MNDSELFFQVKSTLTLRNGGICFFLDARTDGLEFEFALEQGKEGFQPLRDNVCFQQLLVFHEFQIEIGSDQVRKLFGIFRVQDAGFDLIPHGRGMLENFLKQLFGGSGQGFRLFRNHLGFVEVFHPGLQVRAGFFIAQYPDAFETFDQDPDMLVGLFDHLLDARQTAEPI